MTINNLIEEKTKLPRVRSVAYPSITISDSIELTNRIYKIFGNITYTSREAISKQLHISESHLQTQISSCVQFGLLELKTKEGYKPTELFIKVRSPLPDENINEVFISIFSNPELYKTLIEQFNGKQLPQEAGLGTILYRRHKVSEKVASFAAKIFIESSIDCGFLKNDVLNLGDRVNEDNLEIIEENIESDKSANSQVLYLPPRTEKKDEGIEKSEIPPIPIFLDNGTIAKLYMPKGFTKDDLKRVSKVLNGYVE